MNDVHDELRKEIDDSGGSLMLMSLLLISCGSYKATPSYQEVQSAIAEETPLPEFPIFPKLSKEFFTNAPKEDLDKLFEREVLLLRYKKAVERRIR